MDRHRSRIYAMITLFGEEKYKPVIRFGQHEEPYVISKSCEVINTKTGRVLKQSLHGNKNNYNNTYWACSINGRTIASHRLGMETWKPIDQYPPEQLKDDWDKAPESFKQWVRDTAWVDHLGDKETENHVDKMAWVTPRDNCKYVKEARAGNPSTAELNRRRRLERNSIKKGSKQGSVHPDDVEYYKI